MDIRYNVDVADDLEDPVAVDSGADERHGSFDWWNYLAGIVSTLYVKMEMHSH